MYGRLSNSSVERRFTIRQNVRLHIYTCTSIIDSQTKRELERELAIYKAYTGERNISTEMMLPANKQEIKSTARL